MHELQVTEQSLNVALDHAARERVDRILAIRLRVGELSDLEERWLQHYFDYLSRGTLAENARLEIEWAPIVLQCSGCAFRLEVRREELAAVQCGGCGEARWELVSGREYLVKNLEVM